MTAAVLVVAATCGLIAFWLIWGLYFEFLERRDETADFLPTAARVAAIEASLPRMPQPKDRRNEDEELD